jgi:MFS family permease
MSLEGGGSVQHHLWRIKYTELNELYATMTLRTLGASLIAIFIPIFLLKIGYSLRDIFAINLMMYSLEFLLEYPCTVLIRKYGPKHLIALSLPFLIAHFLLLMTLPTYHWPLWTIAATGGITMATFWQAYHYDFSRTKHRKKTSREVSKLYISIALMGAIAPFIGGYIATHFGISWVYALATFILIIAALPLLKTGEPHRRVRKINLGRVDIRDIKMDVLANMGSAVEATSGGIVWPLFIFLIIASYQGVGLITSLALVITVLVTYFVGRWSDKTNRKKYIKMGGLMSSFSFILQTLASTVLHVFSLNIFRSLANSVFATPFASEYYLHADEQSRSEYLFYMESAVDLGRVILFFVLFVSTFFLQEKAILIVGLSLGALGAFLSTLMPLAKCEICDPIENKELRVGRRPA